MRREEKVEGGICVQCRTTTENMGKGVYDIVRVKRRKRSMFLRRSKGRIALAKIQQ